MLFQKRRIPCQWVTLYLWTLYLGVTLAQECPDDWSLVENRCYRAVVYANPHSEDRTWTRARAQCRQHGGDLVSINSQRENADVNAVRKRAGLSDDCYYWIGLTDAAVEGRFAWVDNTKPSYTQWFPSEPTSNNPTEPLSDIEDYVIASGTKDWSDVRNDWTAYINYNSEPAGFVCERDPVMSAVPDPEGEPTSAQMDQSQSRKLSVYQLTTNRNQGTSQRRMRSQSTYEDEPAPEPPVVSPRQDDPTTTLGPPTDTNLDNNSLSANMGPAGPQGPPGNQGPDGLTGLPGSPGAAGPRGPPGQQGMRGVPGVNGLVGPRGLPGVVGPPGAMGNQGPPGLEGVTGAPGEPGVPGLPGERGDKGDKGDPGEPGTPGTPGDDGSPGASGQTGDTGDKGEKGDRGDPGPQGEVGPRGQAGVRGDKGQQGDQGLPGQRGPQGRTGDPGEAGSPGWPGTRGPMGSMGPPGPPGPEGAVGAPGVAGSPGEQGPIGDPGWAGENGKPGEQGPMGPPGEMGSKGPPGDQGDKGPDGDSGPPGPPGPQGEMGQPGPPGPPGPMTRGGLGPNAVDRLPMGSYTKHPPFFINATAFCSGRFSGVYAHPFHCWQFVTCGYAFGGHHEMSCYSGRRFVVSPGPSCEEDKSCIFGARSYNKSANALRLTSTAYASEEGVALQYLRRTVSHFTYAMVAIMMVVALLGAAVMKVFYTLHCRRQKGNFKPRFDVGAVS